jgi:hypothetical protein
LKGSGWTCFRTLRPLWTQCIFEAHCRLTYARCSRTGRPRRVRSRAQRQAGRHGMKDFITSSLETLRDNREMLANHSQEWRVARMRFDIADWCFLADDRRRDWAYQKYLATTCGGLATESVTVVSTTISMFFFSQSAGASWSNS